MNGPVLQNITGRFITEFRGQQTLPGREGSTSYLLPVLNNKYTVRNLEESVELILLVSTGILGSHHRWSQ